MTRLVIPPADAFGGRVNLATPLGKVVGVLRRANPTAPYEQLKATAEQLRSGSMPTAETDLDPEPQPEPKPVVARPRPRKRAPRSEAEASMVPVVGGEDIPAEPPSNW